MQPEGCNLHPELKKGGGFQAKFRIVIEKSKLDIVMKILVKLEL